MKVRGRDRGERRGEVGGDDMVQQEEGERRLGEEVRGGERRALHPRQGRAAVRCGGGGGGGGSALCGGDGAAVAACACACACVSV